jgi:hypothetical protein
MTADPTAIPMSDMRKLLRIDPANVHLNYAGQVFREIFVRLPSGVIADDLKEPQIWVKVQDGNKALKKFDRVVIVAFDETWLAEAYVENADREKVILARPRVITLSERNDKLLNDGTYRVNWTGAGYNVLRNRDDAVVTTTFLNTVLAERALVGMYPKRA